MANNKMTMLSVALLLCGALILLSGETPAAEAHTLPDLQLLFESTGLDKQVMDITEQEKSLIEEITGIYEADDRTSDDEVHAEHLQRLSKLTVELSSAVKASAA